MWIQYSDYYVPNKSISIENLFDELELNNVSTCFNDKKQGISFFEKIVGYNMISSADNESELEMIYSLLDKMFVNTRYSPKCIDVILIMQEKPICNIGKNIQYQYGLNKAVILNISGNECANFEYSLYLADKILSADSNVNNILIVGVTKHYQISTRVTDNFSLNGDAAGIMLVGREEKKWKHENSYITNFIIEPSEKLSTYKVIENFEKLLQKIPSKILEEDYALVLQNANVSVLLNTLDKYGFKLENIFTSSANFTHLYDLDLLVKTTDFINEKDSQTKYLFLIGTSSTGTISLTILVNN